MNTFKLIIFSIITFSLVGCGPIYKKKYYYQAPRSFAARQCIASNCERNKMMCENTCAANNRSCEWRATEEARINFRQYVREQRRQNLPIKKSLSDFRNNWDCNADCGCESVYRRCYQTCGGQVTSQTVCVAFCDQGK